MWEHELFSCIIAAERGCKDSQTTLYNKYCSIEYLSFYFDFIVKARSDILPTNLQDESHLEIIVITILIITEKIISRNGRNMNKQQTDSMINQFCFETVDISQLNPIFFTILFRNNKIIAKIIWRILILSNDVIIPCVNLLEISLKRNILFSTIVVIECMNDILNNLNIIPHTNTLLKIKEDQEKILNYLVLCLNIFVTNNLLQQLKSLLQLIRFVTSLPVVKSFQLWVFNLL